jgi:hypothetical protein
MAARVFSDLKLEGLNCELATEVAKDFVWEDRVKTLTIQPYIAGKQYRNLKRLQGQLQVVVTDAPALLGIVYGRRYADLPPAYAELMKFFHADLSPSLNFILDRSGITYQQEGRIQNLETSKGIDEELKQILDETDEYKIVYGDFLTKLDTIKQEVFTRLL